MRGASRIEMRSVDELIPYARNARTHSDEQVAKIAASIAAFGFNAPVLVDGDGVLIAGHGRLLGAKKAGLTEVPVIPLTHMSEAERRAYILADNRIAEDAGWDEALLAEELAFLEEADLGLGLTGFEQADIDELMRSLEGGQGGSGDVRPEADAEPPEPPVNPVSRRGDLWLLGPHRLLNGDSTSAEDVGRLFAGVRPHLMVTDPPYGVNYDPSWRNGRVDPKTGEVKGKTGSGGRALGMVTNDDRADWREAWDLFPGDVAYVWHGALHSGVVEQSLIASGFEMRAQIIWAKNHIAIGRGHYHWQHEPAWYAVRKGKTGHWGGDRKQATLWQIDKPRKNETGHGTQKPVECMARPIRNNSSPGQAVFDPFMGSGTTLIAAHELQRIGYGTEISPAYCDVIVKRWQTLAGEEARLDGDGRTFAEIAAERVPEGEKEPA